MKSELTLLEKRIEDVVEAVKAVRAKVDKALNEQEKSAKRWRAEKGKHFWSISDVGGVFRFIDDYGELDNFKYSVGNYFKSEQEAKQHLKNLLTKQKLKNLALKLNNGKEIDWTNDHQNKYFIRYDYTFNELIQGYNIQQVCPGNVYCLDVDFLKSALTVIYQDDLINLIKSGV